MKKFLKKLMAFLAPQKCDCGGDLIDPSWTGQWHCARCGKEADW